MFTTDFFIVLFAFTIAFAILVSVWHFSRSRQLLEKWAEENGYEIIRREHRTLRRGPFFWTTSRGQAVYYVVVRDGRGQERSGWVRCGSWWFGLMRDQVEVKWEE